MKKAVFQVSMHGRPKAVGMLIKVIKYLMPCELLSNQLEPSAAKNKIKAMKIVAGTRGIASIALDGEEKNKIVVLGNDFDPVKLAKVLRCKLGTADIVSVDSSYDEKKEKDEKPEVSFPRYVYGGVPNVQVVEFPENPGRNCCMM